MVLVGRLLFHTFRLKPTPLHYLSTWQGGWWGTVGTKSMRLHRAATLWSCLFPRAGSSGSHCAQCTHLWDDRSTSL